MHECITTLEVSGYEDVVSAGSGKPDQGHVLMLSYEFVRTNLEAKKHFTTSQNFWFFTPHTPHAPPHPHTRRTPHIRAHTNQIYRAA